MNNKANLITHMRRSVIGIISFATLFYGGVAIGSDPCSLKSTVAEVQYPERVFTNETGNIVADFGKDAFGWLEISAPAAGLEYFINIGEILWNANGIVDRNPGVNVRARGVKWHTEKVGFQRVPVAPDLRNEFDAGEGRTIKLPKKYGVVTPFRAVEFYHAEFPVDISSIRRYVI
jgi:hypothetical protein